MNEYQYYCNCVDWPREDVNALTEMIDKERAISRRVFVTHVRRSDLLCLERLMGYTMGTLTMAGDWHVQYYKSKYKGNTAYYFKHSAIEYVFLSQEQKEISVPWQHLITQNNSKTMA